MTAAEPAADASSVAEQVVAAAAVPVADAAVVPAAAVKAKNRFPLTIATLRFPRRNRGVLGALRRGSSGSSCV